MTNEQKALAVINQIVILANKGYIVSLQDDFGEHSMTVGITNQYDSSEEYKHFHTFCGLKTEYELLDSLYKNLNRILEEKVEVSHPIREY